MRRNLQLWAWFARRPTAYRAASRLGVLALHLFSRRKPRFRWLPLAGNWTAGRDFPAPEGETFFARYTREKRK